MIKAAFFDIDGTLVSFRTHRVPVSAHEALRALCAAGIRLFLATGRAAAAMPQPVVELCDEDSSRSRSCSSEGIS